MYTENRILSEVLYCLDAALKVISLYFAYFAKSLDDFASFLNEKVVPAPSVYLSISPTPAVYIRNSNDISAQLIKLASKQDDFFFNN